MFAQKRGPLRAVHLLVLSVILLSSLMLAGCGSSEHSATPDQPANGSESRVDNTTVQLLDFKVPVTPVASRTAQSTRVTSTDAATALGDWNTQILGINPSISKAGGLTTQVLATYQIPTNQYGTIQANINGSRAAYGGQLQNGGVSVLLLGGGSDIKVENIDIQIKKASLGYTQLSAATYPSDTGTALAQLKQAFPGLSSYDFQPVQTSGQFSYVFYATSNSLVKGQQVNTAVSVGVVKFDGRIWNYALVGSGTYSLKVSH